MISKFKLNATSSLVGCDFSKHNVGEGVKKKQKAIDILKNMHELLLSKGCYPENLIERDAINHRHADYAVLTLLLYANEHPELSNKISIYPSLYNPELEDYKRAKVIAGNTVGTRDPTKNEILDIANELRIKRQGAERCIFSPGRCQADGWPNANVTYDSLPQKIPGSSIAWGMSIPNIAKMAKLYDIKYTNEYGETHIYTAFLDKDSVQRTSPVLTGNIFQDIEKKNRPILHMFNTDYADITRQADDIASQGFGAVLISPPYTWRDDGPYTSEEKKGQWYHCYQPEDLRSVDNPHGNLQGLHEMVWVLRARGIDVIADIPLNFMGIGGEAGAGGNDNKGTLQYPSVDIRKARGTKIKQHPGVVEAQRLVRYIHDQNRKPIEQFLTQPYTSAHDFESSRSDVTDWECLKNIQENRLDGMPKVKPNQWMIEAQRQYLSELRKIGIKGYRIDAEKHMTSEHFSRVFTPDIIDGMTVFGETITNGYDSTWNEYHKNRLQKQSNIGAYDFPLQNEMIEAFKIHGNLQRLAFLPGKSPTDIPVRQSVTFSINHDIPNNGSIFGHMLFSDPVDELLANAYIFSLPIRTPLLFSDGRVQSSVSSVSVTNSTVIGGKAWTDWWKSPEVARMVKFNNENGGKPGIWFAHSGAFCSESCLAFSRGSEGRIHTAVVVINKASSPVSGKWPMKLEPGVYVDLGPSKSNNYVVTNNGELTLEIPGRTALMLTKKE
ncbi:alpha-amylase family glycosyl hydrolase [Aeromonas veronii]